MGLMIVFSFVYSLYILQTAFYELAGKTEKLAADEEAQLAELEESLTDEELDATVQVVFLLYSFVSIAWAGYIQFVTASALAKVLYHLELMLFITAQLMSFSVPPRFWKDHDFLVEAMWYANVALSVIYLLHCADVLANFLIGLRQW